MYNNNRQACGGGGGGVKRGVLLRLQHPPSIRKLTICSIPQKQILNKDSDDYKFMLQC